MFTSAHRTPRAANATPFSILCAPTSAVAGTLKQITRSVPRPVDSACLLLVIRGIQTCIQSALSLIPDLNDRGKQLLTSLDLLESACSELYSEMGIVDSFATLDRKLTQFSGWSTFAFLADNQIPSSSGRVVAAGMELVCKLVTDGNPLVAPVFMRDLARGRVDVGITSADFLNQIHYNILDSEDLPDWFARSKKNFHTLYSIFSNSPPPPPPPPTLEERVTAKWRADSAYPRFRLRAGVLDKTCLSQFQVDHILRNIGAMQIQQGIFNVILWHAGFCGVTFNTLSEVPLRCASLTNWVICIDLEAGLLWRDFTCMARDASSLKTDGGSIAASYLFAIPIPPDVLETLRQRTIAFQSASNLGGLAPELADMNSRSCIYKASGDILPTWARWARTCGILMRKQGTDNLLAGVITGKLAHTAKSKMYYCCISHQEIWSASASIYQALKFEPPGAMPAGLLDFGASVVPNMARINELELDKLALLEGLRTMSKGDQSRVIEFHNAYVIALAFRFCCLLALRESAALNLFADIDETVDITVDIDDKTNQGKGGALPVVICQHLKDLIILYRAHCKALLARLSRTAGFEAFCDWLQEVIQGEHVPLLCTFEKYGRPQCVGTSDVLQGHQGLAPDFGRKLQENWLRKRAVLTRDTDRQLRHEVLGQESYSSATEHTEFSWAIRVLPHLDALAEELFPNQIHGLRSK